MTERRAAAPLTGQLYGGQYSEALADEVRRNTDPLERQQIALALLEEARDQWKREAGKWAAVRAEAVQELKQGRTWAQVAEDLGVSEATAWNIAHPKERA